MDKALDKDSDLAIPPPIFGMQRPRRPSDDSNRRMIFIAGGVGSAMVALVAAWSFGNRHSGAIPVILADSRPLRVKPDNPGGLQVPGASESVLADQGDGQTEALAGPPEKPDPLALRAQQQAQQQASVPQAAPAPAAPAVVPASLSPPAIAAPVAPPPPIPAAPIQRPAATRPAEPRRVAAAEHDMRVQFAALPSEGAAKAEWERLSRRMPDLLGGRQPQVVRTEHGGHVYWRLRTGGFSDNVEAVLFCERVRAKGAGCSVASF